MSPGQEEEGNDEELKGMMENKEEENHEAIGRNVSSMGVVSTGEL